MRRLVWASASRIYHNVGNLMLRLNYVLVEKKCILIKGPGSGCSDNSAHLHRLTKTFLGRKVKRMALLASDKYFLMRFIHTDQPMDTSTNCNRNDFNYSIDLHGWKFSGLFLKQNFLSLTFHSAGSFRIYMFVYNHLYICKAGDKNSTRPLVITSEI